MSMGQHPLIILGVDPGLQHTGWGIIRQQGSCLSWLGCGSIHPRPSLPLSSRLHHLHIELSQVIARFHPDEAAIEQTFINNNAASSLKLGNARGALLLSLALHHLPVMEYDATLVKKTVTGAGRADKTQIGMMVRTLLPACPADAGHDAMDALAVAITHSQHARMNRIIYSE